jgi:hypothetical protein
MSELTLKATDTDGDRVVIEFADEHGNAHKLTLASIQAISLLSAINAQLAVLAGNPDFRGYGLPDIPRIQLVETPEKIFLRIFVGTGLYHEYPIEKGTTLAADVQVFADRGEARQEAATTHQPPDSPSGKKH